MIQYYQEYTKEKEMQMQSYSPSKITALSLMASYMKIIKGVNKVISHLQSALLPRAHVNEIHTVSKEKHNKKLCEQPQIILHGIELNQ